MSINEEMSFLIRIKIIAFEVRMIQFRYQLMT